MAGVIPTESSCLPGAASARAESDSLALPPRHPWFGTPLSITLVVLLVLALYWQTTLAMASIWQRSETFAHGHIVIPIFLYLVWRKRDVLAAIQPTPCYAALLGIVAAGVAWLAGELVSAASVSQFAMIAMIPFAVWAIFGARVAKVLGIPLGFLFFAVPVGEFLVPTLMDWTADFTVLAIRASGVPLYREGNYFTIPSGHWSVVEACSGVRYLIASFMVGSLYAYLSYRTPVRRAAFIAASVLVPIVANWLRAYMIVMLGHLTNNRLAAGADHLIYGWIFFGVVMALLFWIGSRWRQDEDPLPASSYASARPLVVPRLARRNWITGLMAIALMAIWPSVEAWLGRDVAVALVQLDPVADNGGWKATRDEVSAWRPDIAHARGELRQSLAKDGARVGLHLAFYRNQSYYAKAITSTNQLVATTNTNWKRIGGGAVSIDAGGQPVGARTAIVTDERERLLVWQWFWVDGRATSNEYFAKFYQLLSVIQGHGDSVAWVIIYTPIEQSEAQARATLEGFTAAMRGSIDATLRQAAAK
jgi:exosortase A